ncbi:MAG TPA: HEAT repeat domain-containing protein [Vicinamibacterales bacterium]|nr:HEAT repeat domain-containing protein [Vicinamibacterales bacterium]
MRRLRLPGTRLLSLCVLPALLAAPAAPALQDLSALAAAITAPKDDAQLSAIAETLNAFLASPVVPRRRVGYVIERRTRVSAEAIFSSGPLALGTRAVPPEILAALQRATHDDNPRVGVEALYAFGVLAIRPTGADRRDLLRASGPDLVSFLGSQDPAMRYGALRVIGRLFERRAADPPVDAVVGDAVINALNEHDATLRVAAMEALGSMREERAAQGLADLFGYYGRGTEADAALDSLARIAHASSAPVFTAALAAGSPAQRVIAIEGLARLGDAAALPAIQAAAGRDRSDAMSLALTFAAAALANGAIDPLVDALGRPKLRDQARGYLVDLAPARRADLDRLPQQPGVGDVLALARLRER